VSRTCTRIIELTFDGLREFPGGYAEFLQHFGTDHLDREAVVRASQEATRAERQAEQRGALDIAGEPSWEEQKRLRNRKKQLPRLKADVEDAIAGAETRQREIQTAYAAPGFFDDKTQAELARLRDEERSLAARIEALMAEWEALELESAQLENV